MNEGEVEKSQKRWPYNNEYDNDNYVEPYNELEDIRKTHGDWEDF